MGLDILILTNNYDDIASAEYFDEQNGLDRKHSLSREFCNFMCRKDVANAEPELDQIGRLTGVDISPIYDMEGYWDDESAEHQLSFANSDEERQQIQNKMQSERDRLSGNINVVLETIDALILKLSVMGNLADVLDNGGEDTIGYEHYFTDFNTDKGKGYIDNNFGQDLRNFKRFLEYAKSKGTTTVWFTYG